MALLSCLLLQLSEACDEAVDVAGKQEEAAEAATSGEGGRMVRSRIRRSIVLKRPPLIVSCVWPFT